MLSLTPSRKNFDIGLNKSDAALPSWKPFFLKFFFFFFFFFAFSSQDYNTRSIISLLYEPQRKNSSNQYMNWTFAGPRPKKSIVVRKTGLRCRTADHAKSYHIRQNTLSASCRWSNASEIFWWRHTKRDAQWRASNIVQPFPDIASRFWRCVICVKLHNWFTNDKHFLSVQ